jgi:DNA polymerase-3 subunit gamma/tau
VADEVPVLRDSPPVFNRAVPQTETPKPVTPSLAPPEAEKPKNVFVANVHSGVTSIKIPNRKDLGKQVEEALAVEEDPYLKGDDKEPFTMDEFLQLWTNHGAKLKAEGKSASLYNIFTSVTPRVLSLGNFEVTVSNKVQEKDFRDERPNVLNFLRTTLKNFSIEVNAKVEESTVVRKPYTSLEKFQHMAAKNPQLIDLKNKFNLDFD